MMSEFSSTVSRGPQVCNSGDVLWKGTQCPLVWLTFVPGYAEQRKIRVLSALMPGHVPHEQEVK